MGFLEWLLLGLISGFIASKLVNKTGEGFIVDIILGVIGAMVGGSLMHFIGEPGITGFDLWSMIVAVIGAVVVLWLYHMLTGRRRPIA